MLRSAGCTNNVSIFMDWYTSLPASSTGGSLALSLMKSIPRSAAQILSVSFSLSPTVTRPYDEKQLMISSTSSICCVVFLEGSDKSNRNIKSFRFSGLMTSSSTPCQMSLACGRFAQSTKAISALSRIAFEIRSRPACSLI
jgi:hypothetical protein